MNGGGSWRDSSVGKMLLIQKEANLQNPHKKMVWHVGMNAAW